MMRRYIDWFNKAATDGMPTVIHAGIAHLYFFYFSEKILEAQVNVQKMIAFIIDKARYVENYRGRLNDRQIKAALRLFREGSNGFKGGLSAENYIHIAKTSRATATRDLAEMVELGALQKTGKLRHTRYYLPVSGGVDEER